MTIHSSHPFADPDPEAAESGLAVTPEGNGHQAEFTRDNELFIATDEDFDPYRVTATVSSGPFAGHEFTAVHGDDVPFIDADTSMIGDTQAVGLACEAGTFPAADPTHKIAVIERGVCDFQVKIDLVKAAGYEGAIVFNRTGEDGCETLVTMLAAADIPAIFVSRTDGFRILGAPLDGCPNCRTLDAKQLYGLGIWMTGGWPMTRSSSTIAMLSWM